MPALSHHSASASVNLVLRCPTISRPIFADFRLSTVWSVSSGGSKGLTCRRLAHYEAITAHPIYEVDYVSQLKRKDETVCRRPHLVFTRLSWRNLFSVKRHGRRLKAYGRQHVIATIVRQWPSGQRTSGKIIYHHFACKASDSEKNKQHPFNSAATAYGTPFVLCSTYWFSAFNERLSKRGKQKRVHIHTVNSPSIIEHKTSWCKILPLCYAMCHYSYD